MSDKYAYRKRLRKVIIIIMVIVLYGALTVYLDTGLICAFHYTTGLYCPGCGMGRCIISMVHGDFYQAFRYNVFWMPLVIPGTILLLWSTVQYIKGIEINEVVVVRLAKKIGTQFAVLVTIFWILRNIISVLAPVVL